MGSLAFGVDLSTAWLRRKLGGGSTLLNGLQHYWKLDEASGTRYDVVGSAHLTDVNTVGYAAGKNGNAAQFVAANLEHLSVANDPSFNVAATGFTVNLWSKGGAGVVPVFSKDDSGSNRSYVYYTNGTWYVFQNNSVNSNVLVSPSGTDWQMITLWFDLAVLKAQGCRNAGAVQTAASAITGVQDAGAPFYLGRFTANYYEGLMDEIGFWKRPLTADERTELYAAGAGKFHPF